MTLLQELQTLNSEQRRAVELVNGRLLILAGAGSGKTRVLTLRIAYLICQRQVSPKAILGLTFTNKAAAEMRHRLATFVDPHEAKQVTLCTFHSFCMQVLRQDIAHLGYTSQFSLYDEYDVKRLINIIARDLLQQEKGDLPSLSSTLAAIRQARNKGLTPEQMKERAITWHDSFAQQVYARLQAGMRAYNAVDFDHLLSLTVELFERFPEVLARYQQRFRYLLIDEYQDTNPIQYRLASLLSAESNNLCVVGDDDQSIYGWRGAEIKNILDFDHATVVKLEQNYRSTNRILRAATAVIKRNEQRHGKTLWSDKGEGELIEIFHAPTELDEVQAVIKRLVRLKEQGWRWRDMAILYRSNILSRQFELALMRQSWRQGEKWVQGIPYEVVGGLEFYERREVKDLCAYLRVIVNPLDQEALLRIINQPRRGIGEESLDLLTTYNRQHQVPLWDVLKSVAQKDSRSKELSVHVKARKGIEDFVSMLEEAKERFSQGQLADSLKWLLQHINYQQAINEEVKSQAMRDFKAENVDEFVASLEEFEQRAGLEVEQECSLASFVANLALDQQLIKENERRGGEDRVRLMTFHSAKGLEFPACFLVGLEDHIIPHEKSIKERGVEEERRLMYVAMTRAKERLFLSMAQKRKRIGKEEMQSRPSRFLFDIPKDHLRVTDWRVY